MTEEERIEHDNKVIDRNYTIALYFNLLNLFILFIASGVWVSCKRIG